MVNVFWKKIVCVVLKKDIFIIVDYYVCKVIIYLNNVLNCRDLEFYWNIYRNLILEYWILGFRMLLKI